MSHSKCLRRRLFTASVSGISLSFGHELTRDSQMLSMGEDATNVNVYGKQTQAYILEKDEVVDLQIIN